MFIGGNLFIFYSFLFILMVFKLEESILFIEDVGEQFYYFDWMLYMLSFLGKLEKICGLIVGGMIDMCDMVILFGLYME